LPDDAGIEAALGTVFHEYAALCLELGLEPYVFIDKPCDTDHGTLYFDSEMADHMLSGLDYVRDIAAQPGVQMFVEVQIDISPWVGFADDGTPGFGTSDVILIDFINRIIYVFDWKYGAGVPVDPRWNDQAILYLLGAWNSLAGEMFGWEPEGIEVRIIIEQPRAPGGGGVWPTTMVEMLAEGEKIKADAEATLDPDAPCNPGKKQCSFCKAAKANTCKSRTEYLLSVFDTKMDEVEELAEIGAKLPLPKPKALTPEQRSFILLNKDMVTKWFDDLHAEAYADAEAGRPVPGMKLVDGRSPARVWKDEAKAKFMLDAEFGEKAYTKKYLSPTGVEDVIGKKAFKGSKFARATKVGEPAPVLVPETDKRLPRADKQQRFDKLMDEDSLV
jgi:hypothetical protein